MPIAIAATDVTNVAQEFSTETQSRIESFIEYARLFVCEERWGSRAKLAIIYYTAHLLKMSKLGEAGATGPVTAERVGELSRSYGQSSSSENGDLDSTSYGKMIVGMRRQILITPIVV